MRPIDVETSPPTNTDDIGTNDYTTGLYYLEVTSEARQVLA